MIDVCGQDGVRWPSAWPSSSSWPSPQWCLGCPDGYDYLDGPLEPHFTAHLSYADKVPTELWVYGNVCTPSGVVNNVGRFVRVAPRLAELLGRLVRTPRPFPVTDPSLPPGPVRTGPMTDGECPDGITQGQPFAHETARHATLRLGSPVFAAYRTPGGARPGCSAAGWRRPWYELTAAGSPGS